MLKLSEEVAKRYTPEQAEYIEKYAAGLLISWTAEHITNLITPDIGDGFCTDVFPDPLAEEGEGKEPLEWQAHGDVVELLETWLTDIAKQCGFEGGYQAAEYVQGTKYPTMAGASS